MNYFVTGTDTEIGKTTITGGLLLAFAAHGRRAAGMKPVAAGFAHDSRPVSEDAEQLIACSVPGLTYQAVNPYLLKAPTSPHIAALLEQRIIEWSPIATAFKYLSRAAEVVLVEGVGGWHVPLSTELMLADIPRRLNLPVILVAGIRLGAINHTLLTAQAIGADGCRLCGWIANIVDRDYAYSAESLATLRERLKVPCLAVVPWTATPAPHEIMQSLLHVPALLESDAQSL